MAKVKLIETSEKFVVVLERSQLFAPNQLEAIKTLAETAEDPIQIARALLKNGWVTKWQASQMLSGFYHLTIGKYHLSDQLGKGELGNVYLAENPRLGRKVALKTLAKKYTGDPEVVKRFLNEARAASALDHRNIIHVHDVSSEAQRHYVVMEYVSGRDLQSRVDTDGALPIADAISFIRQVAEGLQHAHEQGVIHRDMKPANIMVDDQGVVKILDMGVGHLRKAEKIQVEDAGELMMSAVAYMAPEHARGQQVDARCDVYSLGAVFYFLITARAPFSTNTDAERAKIKESKRPIPLRELRTDVPPPLVDLCDRMMELQPDDRFASMGEVLGALASAANLASDVATSSEDAKPAEVESAVRDAEAEEVAPQEKEVEPKPKVESKSATPAFSIDVGGTAKPASTVAPTDFAINTKKRKKKPAAAPAAAAAAKTVAEEPVEKEAIQPANVTNDSPATEDTPELASTEPEAASTEPGLASTEPKLASTEPGLASTEPGLASTEPKTASTEPETASTEPKRDLSKVFIIGGACAAALLLMVGSGVGALMLFGGSDKELVQAAAATPTGSDETLSEAAASDDTPQAASDAPEDFSDFAPDSAANIASGEAPAATEPDNSANEVAAVGPANSSAPAEGAGSVAVTAPAATADSSAAMPNVATEAPAAPATSTTEPMPDTPAPEKPSEEKPAEEKPAEEKPAPESKPEPKKPPEKKAPPKPKTFVFQAAIDLPTPTADAPELILGQINIGAQDAVFISLDGGDIAAAGRFEFSVQNAQDGVAPRDWEFYLSDGNADPLVIATMSMPEKDLKFKWTPAGVEHATATNLRNCSLKITAGQDQPQDLALRTPRMIAPITIDLEKSATAKLPLEGAPDRNSLKLEVTVKGHKSLVEPAQIELGKGGEAFIYFGENQEQAALALKLDVSVNARGIQVKTDPYFIVPVERAPVRLNRASMKRYEAVQVEQARLQNQVVAGQRAASEKKATTQQKAQIQAVLAGLKQQLDLVDKTVQKMSQLSTDRAAIGAGASLQFRVFSDTFEKQIDLIVTDPNAAPVAP
ncbi:MAG TPA: protein kinase [Pirellulaceae bacterium]|nr:protein kinase [Pirellulaceae bacterium]